MLEVADLASLFQGTVLAVAKPPPAEVKSKAPPPAPVETERPDDWWDCLQPEEYRRLTTPRPELPPCLCCGRRLRHDDCCYDMLADREWGLTMPFGKHKGKLIRDIRSGYLAWLWKNTTLIDPVRGEVLRELVYRQIV